MIGEETTLREALSALGRQPDEVIAAAQSPETKEALHQATDQAKKLRIFGAPSFVVDNELFWGDDRLENALAWQGQD